MGIREVYQEKFRSVNELAGSKPLSFLNTHFCPKPDNIYMVMVDIEKIIMGNSINARVFSLGKEVYIVGGYLRDVLLGKKSKDIDYIVRGDIKEFACQLLVQERKTKVQKLLDGATIVELKKEQMIRIVLKEGVTLDFTRLTGKLEDNLRERDFTMNALAWSPKTGIIDLLNGVNDIKCHRIRGISIDNFRNDPLRLLRVYRFAAELGWNADIKTRKMVKQLNRAVKRSASERITLEFFRLLNSKASQDALKLALMDGLLECFLSISHKKLAGNIKALPVLESTLEKIPLRLKLTLEKPFSQELTLRGLLRLEQALNGSIPGKNRLGLSRLIRERLKIVHKLLTASEKYNLLAESNIFDTFVKAKDAVFDFLTLSGNIELLSQAERFKRIWKKSFLTSEEIMVITGLKQGVALGKLIYGLKKMEFEGKLKTKKEATKWLNLKV